MRKAKSENCIGNRDLTPYVLAWIPPGKSMMGSPESESVRKAAEGPQHQVKNCRGYWFGKTDVTMGNGKQ
jgi:formylglycine-generating enzyme required for sulfatase activity